MPPDDNAEATPILWPTSVTGTVEDFDRKFQAAVERIFMRENIVGHLELADAVWLPEGVIQMIIWEQSGLPPIIHIVPADDATEADKLQVLLEAIPCIECDTESRRKTAQLTLLYLNAAGWDLVRRESPEKETD